MDGISVAASGFVVASLALQLLECLKNLSDFWGSIGDAPEYIRDIAREINNLSAVVESMSSSALLQASNSTLDLVLQPVATHIGTLKTITSKLEVELRATSRAKQKWAAVKTVFKTNKIKQAQQAIERAEATLLLAHQIHLSASITIGFGLQRAHLDSLLASRLEKSSGSIEASPVPLDSVVQKESGCPSKKNSYSSIKYRRKTNLVTRSGTWFECVFGTLRLSSQSYSASIAEDEERDTHKNMVLHPAPWLSYLGIKYGLRLAIYQSSGHWRNNLETFRPVPNNSLIFQFCEYGIIEGVKSLFSLGEASIWDTDSSGSFTCKLLNLSQWKPC